MSDISTSLSAAQPLLADTGAPLTLPIIIAIVVLVLGVGAYLLSRRGKK